MPPKVKYTRDDVLTAAVNIVEENGLKQLTARNVAEKLGSSTAPVYRHFATMNELALEVLRNIQKQLLEYTSRPYTDRIFLNMGTGTAMFACEHSELYKALLMENNSYGEVVQEFLEILESELTKDKRFTSLTDGERRQLLRKMWTFTHGLASLICVGLIKECNQKYIIDTLSDVGADVINATLAKHDDNQAQKK